MLRTAVLSVICGSVIAADWIRLERPPHVTGRIVVLVALAIVPALVRARRFRILALAGTAIVGAAIAFSLSLRTLWPDGAGFFGPLGSRFSHGIEDFYVFRLPIDRAAHVQMHMLLLAAAFSFSAIVALAIAARRAVAAVAFFLVAAGWPATLLAGGHELGRGAVILVAALALLVGLTDRPRVLAAPATAVIVLTALALSTSAAVARPKLVDWQQWNPYAQHTKPVSVSFVWNANYSGIRFPTKPTTVLSINAPAGIGTYWRATVLDEFVGDRWVEHLWRESAVERRALAPQRAARPVAQVVTVGALRDRHLIGASIPVKYTVNVSARNQGQDVVLVAGELHPGLRYLVSSAVAHPTPRELLQSPPIYPKVLARRGHELEIAPGVDALPFGAPGRDATLLRKLVGPLLPYRTLLTRARQIVGSTRSPYAAVDALEQWFRATGGFTYSEQPPQTPGLPPLVDFVMRTRSGYCQHFAGGMALMARLLGIPARVAAGFVTGRYANGVWTITDHDAHTWVEVWFRGYGWLPFDPTPGRGHLAAPYSAASAGFDPLAEAKLLARFVRGGAVFGAAAIRAQRAAKKGRLPGNVRFPRSQRTFTGHHGRTSILLFLAFLAAALGGALALLKFGRRRARYLTRDPRRLATACMRDLSDFLADQRLTVGRASTVRDLGHELEERLALNADAFADTVDAARFGPRVQAGVAAGAAQRELAALKQRLRRRLGMPDRLRGFVSLRSLGLS